MFVFSHPEFDGHEKVLFGHDAKTGLKAIIAVHNTARGAAVGGCRFWNYESDAAALTDVLRLSRGMTYKSALASLPFGGGKSVIIGDPKKLGSEAFFLAMGRLIDSLGGLYSAAEDVGISVSDVEAMGQATPFVRGTRAGEVGDPSPFTAYGVFKGIEAAVAHRLGRPSLKGVTVAVQGLGHVGFDLSRQLHQAGASLVVADLNRARLEEAQQRFGAVACDPQAIVGEAVDVFAPCALGAVINDQTLPRLKAAIVAGAANNQLAQARHGDVLRQRGILYAPDYCINAGGIIVIAYETQAKGARHDRAKAMAHIDGIHSTLLEIFKRSDRQGLATSEVADHMAEERFKAGCSKAA
jgi:leucine dehydrogenase|tara:strand:- start:298 stop:1359 length:1062 start_codon:yes stop_codon:yes gene_type:complete